MNKPGYKQTSLGWIPEDWGVKRLEELCAIQQGVSKGRVIAIEDAITVPYMRVANVKDGEIDLTEVKEIMIHKDELSKYTLAEGDILITEGGDPDKLGRGGIWSDLIENCVFQNHLFRIRANSKTLSHFYLYNYFQGFRAKTYFLSCAKQTTGIASINSSQVKATPIPLPPLPEQRRIAAILSTWDAAIAKEQQLIAALQKRHRALLQQLLSGKKRLKGFKGEWKAVKLRELFKEIKETNDGKAHSAMTISARHGLISQQDKFDKVIAGDSLEKYTLLRKGDFAYNKGNSKLYEMGCIYRLEKAKSAIVPFVYICFRPTSLVESSFYKYWFAAHGLDRQLKKIITSGARGDGLLNVNTEDFFRLNIPFPPFEEQTAIATILSTSENEIQIHRRHLVALQQQKKGLMQILLTGKVRVKT